MTPKLKDLYHLLLHHTTTTAVQMAAPVPEIKLCSSVPKDVIKDCRTMVEIHALELLYIMPYFNTTVKVYSVTKRCLVPHRCFECSCLKRFSKYHMIILLGNLNAIIGKEDAFKLTTGTIVYLKSAKKVKLASLVAVQCSNTEILIKLLGNLITEEYTIRLITF
jgi:hypothetical protein